VPKDRELWNFVAVRLGRNENVILLIVAESTGSSPGRPGYKMAVGYDGELIGSIGGGVMEVGLVEKARAMLASGATDTHLSEQVHRRNALHPSGMICSGQQTVILKHLPPEMIDEVLRCGESPSVLAVTSDTFAIAPAQETSNRGIHFEQTTSGDFLYREHMTAVADLYIVGGGHCALALSDLMSKMDFRIHIFDDRPDLNTLQKNHFADEIVIIESYEKIGEAISSDPDAYVVIMTLGYKMDALVIRQLADRDFKYFGVLGSKAKMATLLKELRSEGVDSHHLDRIHAPIGIPINSRSPEEIAVSIAAEIISVKNS
jgi:xanthine dehydrogenase accessory factor